MLYQTGKEGSGATSPAFPSALSVFFVQHLTYPATVVGSFIRLDAFVVLGQFTTGLGSGAAFIIPFVFMADMFSDKLRQTGILSILMGWSIGEMSFFLIDGHIETWQTYMIGCLLIPVLIELVLGWRLLVESPIYLSKRSREACLASLNAIAQWNDKPTLSLEEIPVLEASTEPKYDFRSVLTKEYLRSIILMGICKMTMGMYYYGIQFAMDSHTLSFGVNMLMLGTLELFGYATLSNFSDNFRFRYSEAEEEAIDDDRMRHSGRYQCNSEDIWSWTIELTADLRYGFGSMPHKYNLSEYSLCLWTVERIHQWAISG